MAFLVEADKLKQVERSNVLLDLSRHENSAEHSWHVALWALVFADAAPKGCNLAEAVSMLLLHDLVEIDAGDHPVDQTHDDAEVARKEQLAADRLFGMLPADFGLEMRTMWDGFEAQSTPAAVFAKRIDHIQPIYQVLCAPVWREGHSDIARHTLFEGRAKRLASDWPELHQLAAALLDRSPLPDSDTGKRLRFLAEADRLKSVSRASRLTDASRFENSAEHSWHVALYALVLADQAPEGCDLFKVVQMLVLHDLVEIDAGDAPVFGAFDATEIEAAERRAADRIFGLLPSAQGAAFRAIWDEFEAAHSAEARFAKALDRFAPPVQNLNSGGGSWVDYNVDFERLSQRIGGKIERGAPGLWAWLAPRAKAFMNQLARAS